MAEPRFLIGFGERLTEPIAGPPGGGGAPSPYDSEYARQRLAPQFLAASTAADSLPETACPDDRIVSILTLHPSFVSKSKFPGAFLQAAGFDSVGSRPTSLTPELNMHSHRNPDGEIEYEPRPGTEERATTELYVASTRSDLSDWTAHLADERSVLNDQEQGVVRVEQFRFPSGRDRQRLPTDLDEEVPLEIVLHAAGNPNYAFVLEAFEAYAVSLDADPDLDRRLTVGSLCFVPTLAPRNQIDALSDFSFLRVARAMPQLRLLEPVESITRAQREVDVAFPIDGPDDPELRIAVFDGGLEPNSQLQPWATSRDTPGLGEPVEEYLEHGTNVTSAVLFGSIDPDAGVTPPYGHVDHYRVLDSNTDTDPYELYDVIRRIESVLTQDNYDFINLSVGPALPIEDDEIHSWTAALDQFLADGQTLATVAVGNNGRLDRAAGNARIQVPSDAVNALSVGASSSQQASWARAPYSAFGPGRTPGIVKPDVLGFGGTATEPFLAFGLDKDVVATAGTSFAAPAVLRTAAGVRCLFGERLDPLALKALLIHTAEHGDPHDPHEHGWGRVSHELEPIILCEDGTARVVYQGTLTPGKYLRAQLPVPDGGLQGMVNITATLAFASEVEPEQPSNYTRSGIEVAFRPDQTKFAGATATQAKTAPFFSKRPYATEAELRADAHKWETVLHETVRKRGSSLNNPVLDIHHNAREGGHDGTSSAEKVRYAMVITVESKNTPDLYDQVLRTYATQLEALAPRVNVPIRVQG